MTARPCPVCGDERAVELVRLLLPRVSGRGVSACPKCSPEKGHFPLPILTFPMCEDLPRSAA